MTFSLDGFDAIHASPPCQDHSAMRNLHALNGTGWMLETTRSRLEAQLAPWVIENVPGAPMRVDFKLCGCMFGDELKRERWFETSWRGFDLRAPCSHLMPTADFTNSSNSLWRQRYGQVTQAEDMRRVTGIDWMTREELRQAIPPAYTEYIGRKLMDALNSTGMAVS